MRPTWEGGWICGPASRRCRWTGSCPRALLPELSADDRRRVYYYAIFPNMLLSLHPDYMMVHTLWPIAPDRTINVCEWHFQPSELARPDFDAVRRDRFLGHDEPTGLACVRAVAGRHLVARLHARAVLESRGSALRLRPDDRANCTRQTDRRARGPLETRDADRLAPRTHGGSAASTVCEGGQVWPTGWRRGHLPRRIEERRLARPSR